MTHGVQRSPEELEKLKKGILDWLLTQPGGTFAAACKSVNVPFSTAYDWRTQDAEFDKAVKAARDASDEMGGDLAESKLMKAINNEELTAILFYLKTKHKKRGYVERQETDHGLRKDAEPEDADIIANALALLARRGQD